MTTIRTLAAISLTAIILTGCAYEKPQPTKHSYSTVRVVRDPDGAPGSVTLPNTQHLEVLLDKKEFNDHQWSLETPLGPDSPVAFNGQRVVQGEQSSNPGQTFPQLDLMEFQAQKVGTAQLNFILSLPWNKNTPPVKRWTLNVTVTP